MKRTLLTLAMIGFSNPVWAVETVTPSPMVAGNVPAIGTFTYVEGESIPMPLITWGADLATIHANGDAAITAAGSILDSYGISLRLFREDTFEEQVHAYLRGETPFLRGTTDMITAASELLCQQAETCPQLIYNHSRSTGGDILIGNTAQGVNDLPSLEGKTIGLQLYGPHMNLLIETLALADLRVNDDDVLEPGEVNVQWYADLGFDGDNSAAHAFQAGEVDAAFVVFPDMIELTEGDGRVVGARNIFSTLSLDNVIFDVIAVNPVFAEAEPQLITDLVNGLLRGNEALQRLIASEGEGFEPSVDTHADRSDAYKRVTTAGAQLLFGEPDDATFQSATAEMFVFDLQMQGWTGNVRFLTEPTSRGIVWYGSVAQSATEAFAGMGIMQSATVPGLVAYNHDWDALHANLSEERGVQAPRFDEGRAAALASTLSEAGPTGNQNQLLSFEVTFAPNQSDFSAALYGRDFQRVLDVLTTSGNTLIVVEGHAGTLQYLFGQFSRSEQNRLSDAALSRIATRAELDSMERAEAVIAAIIAYARDNGYTEIRTDQMQAVPLGLSQPAAGYCDWRRPADQVVVRAPCGPDGWSNMSPASVPRPSLDDWNEDEAERRRVVFRIYNVEAELGELVVDDF